MRSDGSDGLEVEGSGGSLKGCSGWNFPLEKMHVDEMRKSQGRASGTLTLIPIRGDAQRDVRKVVRKIRRQNVERQG